MCRNKENNIQIIAFYLPQYHPIPENDNWYGKDFTEWTNVSKSKPYFKDHYQPIIPSDLGYYDLRNPEVREQQANFGKEAGIAAFCYYHYWFGNRKQLLELPLNEVVRTGKPDFPFCIVWANHSWHKKMWDSEKSILNRELLIKQEYPGEEDIVDHFYTLLPVFQDKRYYKIHRKLVFVFYKVEDIPDLEFFKTKWQQLAVQNNLPEFFFISYSDEAFRISKKCHLKCDATILSLNTDAVSKGKKMLRIFYRAFLSILSVQLNKPLHVYSYSKIIKRLNSPLFKDERIFPVIIPNWDNTARRGTGAFIFHNSTPELFKIHIQSVFKLIMHKKHENKIVFLKSWNEWGEGNYMEPDSKNGKGYIYALREALDEFRTM